MSILKDPAMNYYKHRSLDYDAHLRTDWIAAGKRSFASNLRRTAWRSVFNMFSLAQLCCNMLCQIKMFYMRLVRT